MIDIKQYKKVICSNVQNALEEDVGTGDITSIIFSTSDVSNAKVVCRQKAILCGIPWFEEVFRQIDKNITITWDAKDGSKTTPGQIICQLHGATKNILIGERVALNFLQTLSGTATTTHKFQKKVKTKTAILLDTRKTIPGLRIAQKYAVTCGGSQNHRLGLYDHILIKDNHIKSAGSITKIILDFKNNHPKKDIEIEVSNLDELKEALENSVSRILLDNFSADEVKQAVKITDKKTDLEASGSIDLENIEDYISTGVDYISIGSMTKNILSVDYSLQFID
jgi:nicotinate-nucleotide pyrophosphorylase (carboxylating)